MKNWIWTNILYICWFVFGIFKFCPGNRDFLIMFNLHVNCWISKKWVSLAPSGPPIMPLESGWLHDATFINFPISWSRHRRIVINLSKPNWTEAWNKHTHTHIKSQLWCFNQLLIFKMFNSPNSKNLQVTPDLEVPLSGCFLWRKRNPYPGWILFHFIPV